MFQHFAQSSNGIVSSVVELSLFALLFFYRTIHVVIDGSLDTKQANLTN